jgi:hypothetical protein
MRYLRYFESSDELTPEIIKDMFLDISDMDWDVRANKAEKMFDKKTSNTLYAKDLSFLDFELVEYFQVKIRKDYSHYTSRRWTLEQKRELENLINSDTFKEVIEVANDRLNDFGWYIDMNTLNTQFSKILFNIYKYQK